MSIKIRDTFYTVEYSEERDVEGTKDIKGERKKLWDACNGEVDNQIAEILKLNNM